MYCFSELCVFSIKFVLYLFVYTKKLEGPEKKPIDPSTVHFDSFFFCSKKGKSWKSLIESSSHFPMLRDISKTYYTRKM